MATKTGAAFSVRFLRNGDQVFVVRNIVDKNGAGAALFQVVDPTSGVVAPDWTVEDNQPIIRLSVRSSAGYPAEITDVEWKFNGVLLNFAYNANNWVTASNDSRFQARINGDYYELKVVGNIASKDDAANKQISYKVSYASNGMNDTVEGSVDVLVQAAGSNSHVLQIAANNVEIDKDTPQSVLTAVGYYGTESVKIGSDGYTVKWYQDGVEMAGQTASTLTVTRDMVTGGSLFICKLFLNGNAVAQDSQRIADLADEYQIGYKPGDNGKNYVGIDNNATFTLFLNKNNALYAGEVNYTWQVYNAEGTAKTKGTGETVTVTKEDCLVGSGNGSYYSDADVQVTAEF